MYSFNKLLFRNVNSFVRFFMLYHNYLKLTPSILKYEINIYSLLGF